jgi:hypothetical protein
VQRQIFPAMASLTSLEGREARLNVGTRTPKQTSADSGRSLTQRRPASAIVPRTPLAGREPISSRRTLHHVGLHKNFAMRSIHDSFGWRSLDSAPLDEDVTLLVTDGASEPYQLKLPCRRTAAGWVSSSKGTPLAVTPVKWKALPTERRKP